MCNIRVTLYPRLDQVIWTPCTNGKILVAYAFVNLLEKPNNFSFQGKIWNSLLIPKLNVLFWMLMQSKVLTQDNLCKRGFAILNRYVLCESDAESSFHLLLGCSFYSLLQSKFLCLWNLDWVFLDSLCSFVEQQKCPSSSPILFQLWDLMAPHVAQGIWKECNNKIFYDSKLKINSIFIKIHSEILENSSLIGFDAPRYTPSSYLARYDLLVISNWKIPLILVEVAKSSLKARLSTKWKPPPSRWVKINFDGAAKGNLGPIGCGGC